MEIPERKSRNIIISNDISQASIGEIIKTIFEINEEDDILCKYYKKCKRTPIMLFINSFGGSVYDGLALVDVIEQSKTDVYTICIGSCMSMSLWIWLSGKKRLIGKNATLMFHDITGFVYDKIEVIKQELTEFERFRNMYIKYITDKSLVTEKQLQDYIERKAEWYISAEDAIKLKLADDYYIKIKK